MTSGRYDLSISGVITQGHQVASGQAIDCPYPEGTIRAQLPFFRELGLDISHFYMGTLNIDIKPACFKLIGSDYSFKKVKWTDRIPAEDFSFSKCIIEHKQQQFKAYIYHPHPETKVEHFHNPSLIEVICERIDNLSYRDKITLHLKSNHIRLINSE